MKRIPEDRSLDSTLALALDGYKFISKKCQRYQTDIFQTRLLLEQTICFKGEEAAKLFYNPEKFTRKKAAPKRIKKTLFGQGGVQGLDGDAHRQRKQMFMSLMTDERIKQLADLTSEQWCAYAKKWEKMDKVVLLNEAQSVFCRAVCAWAGVPLQESAVEQMTNDLAAMIDSSGAVGPKHWQGRRSRERAEKWIENVIEQVRTDQLEVPEESATHVIAWHRCLDGKLLDKRIAAVEIINVLRPTVAVARYVTFAALALHEHPECRQKLQIEDNYLELFVQEVRRFYPFFPFASARVLQEFDWQGYHFPQGRRVLLDLYGTNHDPRLWDSPEDFVQNGFASGMRVALISFLKEVAITGATIVAPANGSR